jgi:hypothetical protein
MADHLAAKAVADQDLKVIGLPVKAKGSVRSDHQLKNSLQ